MVAPRGAGRATMADIAEDLSHDAPPDRSVDIIVVDDDPATGELSRDLLERAGYKVLLLENSDELLPSLPERRPRALVLDMMMPGIDGMELLRAIKGNPATAHIKVALVTAKAFSVERQRAYNLGADLF